MCVCVRQEAEEEEGAAVYCPIAALLQSGWQAVDYSCLSSASKKRLLPTHTARTLGMESSGQSVRRLSCRGLQLGVLAVSAC